MLQTNEQSRKSAGVASDGEAHLQRQFEAGERGVKGGHEAPQEHHVDGNILPDARPLHFQRHFLPSAAQPAPIHLHATNIELNE